MIKNHTFTALIPNLILDFQKSVQQCKQCTIWNIYFVGTNFNKVNSTLAFCDSLQAENYPNHFLLLLHIEVGTDCYQKMSLMLRRNYFIEAMPHANFLRRRSFKNHTKKIYTHSELKVLHA